MSIRKGIVAVFIFCGFIAGCKTFSSPGVVVAPPAVAGATYVGMGTCAMCHEQEVKEFERTTHARMVVSNEKIEGQGCEACHGAGSLHADAEGREAKRATIINPGKDPQACFRCHLDKKAEFSLPYHHPVPEGKISCTDCHDAHTDEGVKPGTGRSLNSQNEVCGKCHKDQTQPFVYEHEALREGCSICHNVHGSINEKMLKERDANLCLKCHYQTQNLDPSEIFIAGHDHAEDLERGPCFSGGCHVQVHGSNYSPRLRM